MALLVWRLPMLRGTTLVGPWCWLWGSVIALAFVAFFKTQFPTHDRLGTFEFLAATLTLCPMVAVLGAKRPQHRAWQFVVATLWIVSIIPAADALLFGNSNGVELHLVRRVFLAILIVLGLANYVCTRFGVLAVVYAIGQILMMHRSLLRFQSGFDIDCFDMGSWFVALSVILVCLAIPPRRSAVGWTAAWLNFRDAFGAAWALRVADRLNQAAKKLDWNFVLKWSGFNNPDNRHVDLSLHPAAERSFRMLLRRFVSEKWLRG